MSDVLIKIGNSAGYFDGDILCAFSSRRISFEHSHLLCHTRDPLTRRLSMLNKNGLIPLNHIIHDYYSIFFEYKFEQLSNNECEITRLSDNNTIRFESNKTFIGFDGRAQQMDLQLYLDRRKKTLTSPNAKGKPLFDGPNGIIWYGGRMYHGDENKVNEIWTRINNKLGFSKDDERFKYFPLGAMDVRSHLPLSAIDFNDTVAGYLIESLVDNSDPDNVIVLKKRKRFINWRDILSDIGVTERDILNKNKAIDRRNVMPRRNIVNIIRRR